jgi:hypothetical protein
MAVLIMDIVDVATVLDLGVPAVLAVLMRSVLVVLGVRAASAFIPMRIVPVVSMTIVQVVDVSRMRQARVAAALVVLVRSVGGVLVVGHLGHRSSR